MNPLSDVLQSMSARMAGAEAAVGKVNEALGKMQEGEFLRDEQFKDK